MEIMENFFKNSGRFFIYQMKEWGEILLQFEYRNKYKILADNEQEIGFIEEKGGGLGKFLARIFLRSHRPLDVEVFNSQGAKVLSLKRPFFWILSDLFVTTPDGKNIGSVHRRFAFFRKQYDLHGPHGKVFAKISAGIFKLWSFPIFNLRDQQVGEISKKWGGFLKEMFSDADKFLIDMGTATWSAQEKAVIFAAAISVDFDFFEDNQKD